MSSLGSSKPGALLLCLTTAAWLSACGGPDEHADGRAEAGSGGSMAAAGTSGRSGSSGGSFGAALGGNQSTGGTAGTAGEAAGTSGRPTTSRGGSSSKGDGGAGGGRPASGTGNSPYEIECHGDTLTCGDPTSLLCLGLRVETEVFGYSCSNECESDADCSALPATTDATAGCVDFVNTKYCMLVCRDRDEAASCPSGMYCYAYQGASIGYCLWR